MNKKLLSLLITSLSSVALNPLCFAEEAMVFINGDASDDLSLTVNDEIVFFDANRVALMDLEPGSYKARLFANKLDVGTVPFTVEKNKSTETKVTIIGTNNLEVISEVMSEQDNAASTGKLVGQVFESGGTEPVAGAKISIDGSDISVLTDESGNYAIDIPRGVHSISFSHPDYNSRTVNELRIVSDIAMEAIVSLAKPSAGVVEETLVLGVAGIEEQTALAIERNSASVVSAITSEDFKKFGDSSASDALKRVTGVSVVGGQYAVVRGLAGRYISTTLNDGILPSTDGIRRDVPLDLFPSSVLGGIEISKSFRASLPADTTGGHVGMQLKDVPDDLVNKISASLEYNTAATGKDVLTYNGGGRDWTGKDDGARDMSTELSSATNNGLNNLPNECVAGLNLPGCVSSQEIADIGKSLNNDLKTNTKKAGPNLSMGYALGNKFDAANGEIGIYGAIDYKEKWENRKDAKRVEQLSDGSGNYRDSKVTEYERSQYKVDLTAYLAAQYETDSGQLFKSQTVVLRKTTDTTRFNDEIDIEEDNKQLETTTLDWVERQMLYQGFSGHHLLTGDEAHKIDWSIAYGKTSRDAPDSRNYAYFDGEFAGSSSQRTYAELDETVKNINLNYSYEGDSFANSVVTYKIGASAFDKSRESFKSRFNYSTKSEAGLTQTVNDVLSDSNFDNGYVRLNWQTLSNDWYMADEDGTSLYLEGEWIFDDAWTVNLGVRNEKFHQKIDYPNPDSFADPVDHDESDVLPAINITWIANDSWQWRTAFSQTISRPGLVELNGSTQTDPDTDQIIIGNPSLTDEKTTISNFDFKGEYYFSEDEKITAAIFYKDIQNPIEKAIAQGIDVYEGYTFRRSKAAELIGLELEVEKAIFETDSWIAKVAGNFSFIQSDVTLDTDSANLEGRETRDLQGQSEYLGNLRYTMESIDTGQTISLVANYFGDRIDVVDKKSSGDRIEKGRMKIDAIYQYEMDNGLTLNGKITDLLNPKVVYETNGEVVIGEESYYNGTAVSFGVSYNF